MRTLEELWQDAEPFGMYKDRPSDFDDALVEFFDITPKVYEIRRRSTGALVARVTSSKHAYPEFRRVMKTDIEGVVKGGIHYEPHLIPVTADRDRRRRLRELHPDRLGRDQTSAERAEFTRLAQARA